MEMLLIEPRTDRVKMTWQSLPKSWSSACQLHVYDVYNGSIEFSEINVPNSFQKCQSQGCSREVKCGHLAPVALAIRDPQQTAALNVIELFTARPTLRAKADYTKMRIHTATGENRIRSTAESYLWAQKKEYVKKTAEMAESEKFIVIKKNLKFDYWKNVEVKIMKVT